MTPQVPSVLAEMAKLLALNAQPDRPQPERAHALNLSAAVLVVAAEVWDAAAENLVLENRALARLLDDAADETSLRLSALRVENQRLRSDLIAAQIAAEEAGDDARQDAIWAELVASTERRKLSISNI